MEKELTEAKNYLENEGYGNGTTYSTNLVALLLASYASIKIKEEKSLRDEIAMSMEIKLIPKIDSEETIELISEKLGLEWSDDPVKQIEWSMKFYSIVRYMYADAMISVR